MISVGDRVQWIRRVKRGRFIEFERRKGTVKSIEGEAAMVIRDGKRPRTVAIPLSSLKLIQRESLDEFLEKLTVSLGV